MAAAAYTATLVTGTDSSNVLFGKNINTAGRYSARLHIAFGNTYTTGGGDPINPTTLNATSLLHGTVTTLLEVVPLGMSADTLVRGCWDSVNAKLMAIDKDGTEVGVVDLSAAAKHINVDIFWS